jgi:hypothetical protein
MRRTKGVRRRNNSYSHNLPDRRLPGGFERAFNIPETQLNLAPPVAASGVLLP